MSATPHPYRADIDGLRAVAVMSVMAFHAFPRAVVGGFTGVDVFFVISGFLISGLIHHDLRLERFSFKGFYARRFRRIFPALITVLTASLVYGWFVLAPDEYRELGGETAAGAGFSANLLFWSQSGYFEGSAALKPLLHLWSLGIEEQFYLAWPLLLVFAYERTRRTLGLACVLLALSLAISLSVTRSAPSSAFYLPIPRFWELLLGAILAYGLQHQGRVFRALGGSPVLANLLSAAGLGLLVAGLSLIDKNKTFPGWWALLPTVGAAALIASPNAWLNRRLLANRVMVWIGLISYPLYLWHWPLFAFARIANFGDEPPRNSRLLAIAATFVLASLTYRFIERPIRFNRIREAMPKPLLASMLVCGLAGCVIYATHGVVMRYPVQIRALAAFDYAAQRDIQETAYRSGTCFLGPADSFAGMPTQCVDKPDGSSILIALWGDSHAASLYPGLEAARAQGHYRVAQFTASACPPLLGLQSEKRRNCKAFNDFVIEELRALAPQVVILEGHWSFYRGGNSGTVMDAAALRETVQTLHDMGIERIVVMGSLPTWKIYQPRVAFEVWRRRHVLADRTADLLDESSFVADRFVRDAAAGTAAVVVSPIDLLCDQGACLLSADSRGATPVTWDNDHLSIAGSRLLSTRALAAILGSGVPHP
jgi:peptidoglycan/LPS O-acetylase OafA/YrhL